MRYSWRHYLFSELGVNKIYSFLPWSLESLFGLTFFALSLELDSWFFHQSSTSRYETSEETRSERQIRETGRIWTLRSQSPALQGIKPQKKPNTKKSRQGIYLLRLFFLLFGLTLLFLQGNSNLWALLADKVLQVVSGFANLLQQMYFCFGVEMFLRKVKNKVKIVL